MSSIATSQLTPVAPSTPVAPVQVPQLQALGQMVGRILTGTVIALLNETTLRLQTPAGLLDVAAATPLPSGTPVAIAVQGTTQQPQIVITPVSAESQPPQPAPQAGIPNESGPAQINPSSTEENLPAQASANSFAAKVTTPAEQPGTAMRIAPPATAAALSAAVAVVRNAAATQGSLGVLYADLEAAVTTPVPSLPAPVLDAAKSLLAMRLDVGSDAAIAADDIKTVLMQSGLASAVPAAATAPNQASDIGSALLALRQTLQTWLDQQPDPKTTVTPPDAAPPSTPQASTRANAPMPSYRVAPNVLQALISQSSAPPALPTAAAPREQGVHLPSQTYSETTTASPQEVPTPPQSATRPSVPMPPFRGAPGVPQAPVAASLAATAPPREQAVHLLAQTDAAIARQTLLRIVSLPGGDQPTGSSSPHNNDNTTRVMFEIPVATALGTGIVPMTVTRDGGKAEASESLTSWIASFSIDLAAIGPVHVRIALVGERASVTFSAERPQSAELLAADLPLLGAGLRNAQIEPGELHCRVGDAAGSTGGNRDGATRPQAAAPGMFVDQAS